MNWEDYFNNLATSESEEYKKVGWGTRESLLSKFQVALDIVPFSTVSKVLDIGCGTAVFEEMLLQNYPSLDICAIDVSEEQLKLAKQKNLKINFKKGSITDIPFPDESFECVTCIGILQNFDGSIDEAIDEIYRVLKKQGILYLATIDSECRDIKNGKIAKNPLNKYYVPEELKALLETKGFETMKTGAISTYEDPYGNCSPRGSEGGHQIEDA